MDRISTLLKERTAEQHRAIEEVPVFKLLMSPNFSKEKYVELLKAWIGFIQPLEEKIYASQEIQQLFPDWKKRLKTHLLVEDLSALNGLNQENKIDAFSVKFNTVAEFLGAMYVIEGSSLGSQFIVKKLKGMDHFEDNILNFYQGYGVETGKMWSTFKKTIDNLFQKQNVDRKNEVIFAANNTFSELKKHMTVSVM